MTSVPEKAARTLNVILLAFLLIGLRVWYLAIVKHEEHVELAKRPQHKLTIEPANRGTIRDRFNIPLAVNRIQYNASICYDPIRHLPRVKIIKDASGKKQRIFYRKEYITKFASHLASCLDLDATYIEDLIWSKAAIFPNTLFVIKEDISEEEYYRLHIMERDWPGLSMEISSRRHYPLDKVASNILGYMGPISSNEHFRIREEMTVLENFLKDRELGLPVVLPLGYMSSKEVRRRYQELKDRTYTINSRVGKLGIEGRFDDQLRGTSGKLKQEVDIKGNVLRTLPESYHATPGRRFLLTISSELQEYAEKLLMRSEISRIERFPTAGKDHTSIAPPWIKGGAIVAVVPKTGEIVAMATYPRFSPEDFASSQGKSNVPKWLESLDYIGSIWDGIRPLEREFDLEIKSHTLQEKLDLTLDAYLDMVLSRKSNVHRAMHKIETLHNAIYLQNSIETLFYLSEAKNLHNLMDAIFPKEKGHTPTFHDTPKELREQILARLHSKTSLLEEITNEIGRFLSQITHNDDKILAIDLCRTIAPNHLFDDLLLTQTGDESLFAYRSFNQSVNSLQKRVKEITRKVFHETDFPKWREMYFKEFLAEKRKEEREKNTYQRPYLDYLQEIEQQLFTTFFETYQWEFLACYLLDDAPIDTENERSPYYLALIEKSIESKSEGALRLKEHLTKMDFSLVLQYLKTMRSFSELNRPLWGRYYFSFGSGKNATEMDLARAFYPFPGFGYSRSFAYQERNPLGSIFKFVTAYEGLRQHYLRNSHLPNFKLNPLTIIDQSPPYHEKLTNNSILGYTLSGVPILRHHKGGRVPRGHLNIGRIDLQDALERSSNVYFALLASDFFEKPSDLSAISKTLGLGKKTNISLSGEVEGTVPNDLDSNQSGLYAFSIGQHSLTVTPIQAAMMLATFANGGELLKPQIVHTIANLEPADEIELLFKKDSFAYKELLSNIGIQFPLFTEVEEKVHRPYIWKAQKEVTNSILFPQDMREFLLEALYKVSNGERGTARLGAIRTLWENAEMRRTYYNIKPYLAGKTSTAEIAYRPCLDRQFKPILCKHIWFGGMSLTEPHKFDEVDLVVVVMLRFGSSGKETAPIAAEMIQKWREICQKHKAQT